MSTGVNLTFTEVESIITTMTTRQEKIQFVVALLKKRTESEIIIPEFISLSSAECNDRLTPYELLQVLELLEQQSNCLAMEYRHRYRNESEIYADGQLCKELQEDKCMLSDTPGAYESEIRGLLEIVDYSIKLLPDFDLGAQNVLAGKNSDKPPKDTDTALRLILNEDSIFIDFVKIRRRYKVKDLSRSLIYKNIMEYAEEHQNIPFKPSEIHRNTYNTYDLLKRIFGSAIIYKAFFTISGENGSELIANFCPTYGRLKKLGINIQRIRDTLEDLKP